MASLQLVEICPKCGSYNSSHRWDKAQFYLKCLACGEHYCVLRTQEHKDLQASLGEYNEEDDEAITT